MFDVCMFVFVSYMGFIVIFIVLTVERVEVFWYDVASVTSFHSSWLADMFAGDTMIGSDILYAPQVCTLMGADW